MVPVTLDFFHSINNQSQHLEEYTTLKGRPIISKFVKSHICPGHFFTLSTHKIKNKNFLTNLSEFLEILQSLTRRA